MTRREEIAQGENVVLEFKEARPKDSPNCLKAVGAFATDDDGTECPTRCASSNDGIIRKEVEDEAEGRKEDCGSGF